jgi:hypothetical protein
MFHVLSCAATGRRGSVCVATLGDEQENTMAMIAAGEWATIEEISSEIGLAAFTLRQKCQDPYADDRQIAGHQSGGGELIT